MTGWWGKAEPIYISAQSCTAVCGGVRNVTFSDIEADAEAGVMIVGNSGTPIDNVLLRDIRLRMRAPDPKLAAAIGGNFDSRWTAPTPGLGMVRHDVPAIYCQSTTGLTIRNIDVSWQTGVPAYSTAALGCKDSSGLVLDGLSESGASRPGPALLLDRAHIARSRNLSLRRSGPARRKDN